MKQIESYLFFDGRCDEAIEFYKTALGAKVEMLMRYKDMPPEAKQGSQEGCADSAPPPPDKVMHASLRIGQTRVMVSDGHSKGAPKFEGFGLAITAADAAEVDRLCKALADDGKVVMPPSKTFFASRFGMVADRFGVSWMVLAER